jgi:hypothetical protein
VTHSPTRVMFQIRRENLVVYPTPRLAAVTVPDSLTVCVFHVIRQYPINCATDFPLISDPERRPIIRYATVHPYNSLGIHVAV